MTNPPDDPELRALFVEEFRRHVIALARPEADGPARVRTLHAMRGAAAMMGLLDLTAVLADLENATRSGETDAVLFAFPTIDDRMRNLGIEIDELRSLAPRTLPTPPGGTRRAGDRISSPAQSDRPSMDPEIIAYFFSEARQRVSQFGDALERIAHGGGSEALDDAFRHVHAIKGAASTVGLVSIARGTHALESAFALLKQARREPTFAEMDVLMAARARLALALATPASAPDEAEAMVRMLSDAGFLRERDSSIVSSSARDRARETPTDDVIRVPVRAVAGLAESVADVGALGDRLSGHASTVREVGRRVAEASRSVSEALHRIGPPRPWGAPADALDRLSSVARGLSHVAGDLEREGERFGHDAEVLESLAGGARDALQRLGASNARWLFDRVAPTAESLARREGKNLLIVRQGDDVEIARGLAERLVEPLAQLARNAVTHGVEPPATRLARQKPARATLRLEASVSGERLRIRVEDDGAGIDVVTAGERAVALGLLRPAQVGDPSAVLAALFMPGVSTRVNADTAAGRGIGLDLVYREVRQAGGEITVASRRRGFTRFVITIPMRPIAQRMLVVMMSGARVAIPLERVVRVIPSSDEAALSRMRLHERVALSPPTPSAPAVVLASARGVVVLAVDAVSRAKEFVVRPLPSLLSGVRPWSAATVDGEGRVMPVLDVDALVPVATT